MHLLPLRYTLQLYLIFLFLFDLPFRFLLFFFSSLYIIEHFQLSSLSSFSIMFLFPFIFYSSFPTFPTLLFSSPSCSIFLHYTSISSSILRPSCRYCVLSPLRSYLHVPFSYFIIFASLLLSARFACSLRCAHACTDMLLHERAGIFCLPRSVSVL